MIDTISRLYLCIYMYTYYYIVLMKNHDQKSWWHGNMEVPKEKSHDTNMARLVPHWKAEEFCFSIYFYLFTKKKIYFYLNFFESQKIEKKNQRSCKKAAQLTARLQLAMPLLSFYLSLMQNINPKPSPNNHMHTFKQSNPQPK